MTKGFDLSGEKVVIIGATTGMGLATAQLSSDLGANLSIASRTIGKLQEVAGQIEKQSGRQVHYEALSIEDRNRVQSFLSIAAPFDHLLIPGSTVVPQLFENITETVAKDSFESKFWGPFWAAVDAREHMPKGGSITFYSGIAADRPIKGFVIGAAIDGALNALTRSLANEFGKSGIRVNTISPGLILTPLFSRVDHFIDIKDFDTEHSKKSPLSRTGLPHDCAMAAVSLMVNEFINGEILGVDGGAKSIP